MHEYSLARGLLNQLRQLRMQHGADRVIAIRLKVGEFSGIDAELLQMAVETLTANTSFSGLEVVIEKTPLRIRCHRCLQEQDMERFRFRCKVCDSGDVAVIEGEDLQLESATME